MDFLDNIFPDGDYMVIVGPLLRILLIMVLAFVAYRAFRLLTRIIMGRVKAIDDEDNSLLDRRTDTIGRVISTAGATLILATALVMALQEVGIEITPLLASVGVAGLALGLGAQTLVKDVISGLFILTENQYTIGDVVEVNGKAGSVEEMTLRATFLRDLEGTLHSVPNGDIRTVSNITRGWSRAVHEVYVAFDSDIDAALEALAEVGRRALADPEISVQLEGAPQVTGVEGISDGQVKLRLLAKTHPEMHWAVLRYLRKETIDVFKERGLQPALPQQMVRVTPPA